MRINKYLGQYTHLSRRQADEAVQAGRVTINRKRASLGDDVTETDLVTLDNAPVKAADQKAVVLLLNKPPGYVCSRNGQGSRTVYDLLPETYHALNVAGRLDKDSSGLVLLTNDGDLLFELTHPSRQKEKIYEVELDRELADEKIEQLHTGVNIGDVRPSTFKSIEKVSPKKYRITLEEGRNRQIRRTFEALRYQVRKLHRTNMGGYDLGDMKLGECKVI